MTVGSISSKNTMVILPLGKHKRQKIVIGDDSGSITCFQVKKGEAQVVYKTDSDEHEVGCLALGGTKGSKDKIFVSAGPLIRGLSKKGKFFFSFNTQITEVLTSLFIEGSKIWASGGSIYNLFDNGKDIHYFISPDRINCLTVGNLTNENEYDTILGCKDRKIRVVKVTDKIKLLLYIIFFCYVYKV